MNDIAIQTPDRLLELAVTSGADVDKLEKLMALQERWQASQARQQYFEALAAFQAAAPPIAKSREVMNRDGKTVRYRYAPLDAVKTTLKPAMLEHGFSYSFEPSVTADGIAVTCHCHHVGGHTESATVRVPVTQGHGTNSAQDVGSANTYASRYAFLGVLGITAADDDDDGQGAGPDNMMKLQRMADTARAWFPSMLCIKEGLAEGGDVTAAAEAYAEMPRPVIDALNVAPTKGGLWTTDERHRMAHDKEFQAAVHQIRTDAGWYQRPENEV